MESRSNPAADPAARPGNGTSAPQTPSGASESGPPDLDRDERARLRDRDEEALSRFYDCYFDQVYGYVRRLVRAEHLAEDLTQDIFMHIHRSLESYDPARELRPWVYTIATNKVRDYWRSRSHAESQRVLSVDDERGEALGLAGGEAPDTDIEAEELSSAVAEAVEALPESMRETFVLRYYQGLSFSEIGALVERNEVAVRKRFSRALDELRGSLDDYLAPGEQGV